MIKTAQINVYLNVKYMQNIWADSSRPFCSSTLLHILKFWISRYGHHIENDYHLPFPTPKNILRHLPKLKTSIADFPDFV